MIKVFVTFNRANYLSFLDSIRRRLTRNIPEEIFTAWHRQYNDAHGTMVFYMANLN